MNNIESVKSGIHTRSIQDDQQAVATQWAKTFLHNGRDDPATTMTRFLASCVAQGDFKTKTFLSSVLEAPSSTLSVADYLSHGSRIIIDYAQLSDENKTTLREYFSTKPPVISRSATHAVSRKNDQPVEAKGMTLGLWGNLPAAVNIPRDFGVNIAMGGAGEMDYRDAVISADGYSGHFYFHRHDEQDLLLCGLEQSAPAASAWDLMSHGAHTDQFGQSHSLLGASDTYTAAGSLYFSDPVYQVNLLSETNTLPPDKYGSMQVTLTNENWPQIQAIFDQFQNPGNLDSLKSILLAKPASAKKDKPTPPCTYTELNFKAYMDRIYKLWIANNPDIKDFEMEILGQHNEILRIITSYEGMTIEEKLAALFEIKPLESLPNTYKEAIGRLIILFTREKEQQERIQHRENHQHFLEQLHTDLMDEMKELLHMAKDIQVFYQSPLILQNDPHIRDIIEILTTNIALLQKAITDGTGVVPEERGIMDSWFVLNQPKYEITDQRIREHDQLVASVKLILQNNCPSLGSITTFADLATRRMLEKDEVLARLHSENQELRAQVQVQNTSLDQVAEENLRLKQRVNELETSDVDNTITRLNVENSHLREELQREQTRVQAEFDQVKDENSRLKQQVAELERQRPNQPASEPEDFDIFVKPESANPAARFYAQESSHVPSLFQPRQQTAVVPQENDPYSQLKARHQMLIEHSLPKKFRDPLHKSRKSTGFYTAYHGGRGRALKHALAAVDNPQDYLAILNHQLCKYPSERNLIPMGEPYELPVNLVIEAVDRTKLLNDFEKHTEKGVHGYYDLLISLRKNIRDLITGNENIDDTDFTKRF